MRILISGGSRGIGRACVENFVKNGDSVAFIYKSNHDAARSLAETTGAYAICADISLPDEAKRAADEAISYLGGIDVLINNVGISQIKLFTDITDEMWQKMINTNLSSAFYCSREALKFMINQKSGKIINIASMWGETGASMEVHYSASKAGLIGLTKALAKEVGLSGITVNAVSPGVIMTDMMKSFTEDDIAVLKDETPLNSLGTVENVADAVSFLASGKADFITGQVISVNGGFVI
jgi:3-oxoacyl-[acyl-carrier protein] reductase